MILEAAESKNTRIKLYPHIDFWLSSTSQAMKLVREIKNPLLGVMFCGFHWYAGDKQPIDELLLTNPCQMCIYEESCVCKTQMQV